MQPFHLRLEPVSRSESRLTLLMEPLSPQRRNERAPKPERVVSVWGLQLAAATQAILDLVRGNGHRAADLRPGKRASLKLGEDAGVRLGLLLKAVKPLRKVSRIQAVIHGVERMSAEEAAFWFSKAVNSPDDADCRRAMKALRILLARA